MNTYNVSTRFTKEIQSIKQYRISISGVTKISERIHMSNKFYLHTIHLGTGTEDLDVQ